MIDITGLREDKRPQSSTIVHALLDRLEAAEKERDAAELMSLALRAKIEAMERQEPGFRERCTPSAPTGYSNQFPLYALPGAQHAPSVPEREFLERVIGLCGHRGPSPSSIEAFDPEDKWIADLWRQAKAMLAAAPKPEAKP